ncbi:hypothetical protein [[Phormidium] sp. ETS-05]|uniref:hypothetical protein n=1 Tax=[Phormidium] sp. ETS-05 TaxID=222819 RepID=UPI0035C8F710
MTLAKFRAKSPPLENDDRLSRSEFERRYTAMPHIKKAELIDRVVYIGLKTPEHTDFVVRLMSYQ